MIDAEFNVSPCLFVKSTANRSLHCCWVFSSSVCGVFRYVENALKCVHEVSMVSRFI